MEIVPEKEWAKGLTQVEFEREWHRRFPLSDVIPLGRAWIYKTSPTSRCIDAIAPSYEFEADHFVPEPVVTIEESKVGKDIIPKLNKSNTKKN